MKEISLVIDIEKIVIKELNSDEFKFEASDLVEGM